MEKDLELNCSHCEQCFTADNGKRFCIKKGKELTELTPCLDFKMRQVQPNEFFGLITAMMFSFIQPPKQPVSEEKLAKAKFLAKTAKAQMDKGENLKSKRELNYTKTRSYSTHIVLNWQNLSRLTI